VFKMKKAFVIVCAIIIALSFPSGSARASKSSIVIDSYTKYVLVENNAHERLPIASTTKIMTALLAIELGDLSSIVTIDSESVGIEGSSMFLLLGDEIMLGDLIAATMFVSANDGSVAIAKHVSGSVEAFIAEMNNRAEKIGCKNTNFANPHGLPNDNHYSSAYDLALIASEAIKNDTFMSICSQPNYPVVINGNLRNYRNRNQFLSLYSQAVGIKTGYTQAAGKCFVSAAIHDGMILCGVVLNSADMYIESREMLEEVFKDYTQVCLASAGDYIASIPVEGAKKNYKVVLDKDIKIPARRDSIQDITLSFMLKDKLESPVGYAEKIGFYEVSINGVPSFREELYSTHTVYGRWGQVQSVLRHMAQVLSLVI